MAIDDRAASFSGLLLRDLIGAPLQASCEAQVRQALASAGFIQLIGFNAPPEGAANPFAGGVRTARFKLTHPDQAWPGRPTLTDTKADEKTPAAVPGVDHGSVTVDVPVLAMVKLPSLSITCVDIAFDMELRSAESAKESWKKTSKESPRKSTDASAPPEAGAPSGLSPARPRVMIKGSVTTPKRNKRASDNSAKYHVEIRTKDSGIPEGLSRAIAILAQAVAPSRPGSAGPQRGHAGGSPQAETAIESGSAADV
jgi:hypothetical protein